MRKSASVVCGATVAAAGTHGFVSAGIRLGDPHAGAYQGFFEQALLVFWRSWSRAHGWAPLMDGQHLSHVAEYGRFLARLVLMGWPLLGFVVFRVLSRCELGRGWWRPLAIAIALPLGEAFRVAFRSSGLDEPLAEPARSAVVFLSMVESIGAIGFRAGSPVPDAA